MVNVMNFFILRNISFFIALVGPVFASDEVVLKLSNVGNSLIVSIENRSDNAVWLPFEGEHLAGLSFDVWSLGRGVQVYQKIDADRISGNALVNRKWRMFLPKQHKVLELEISNLHVADERLEKLLAEILDESKTTKTLRVLVHLKFKNAEKTVVSSMSERKIENLE